MNLPQLNGNIIDLILLLFFGIYIYTNSKKGFIYGFFDMLGFIFSLLLAIRLYPIASKLLQSHFSLSLGFANALGFLIIAIVLEPLFYIITIFIDKYINKKYIESTLNRNLGFIPALISALILAGFLLTTIITLPTRPDVKQAVVESKIGGAITHQTLGLERYLSDIFGGAVQDTLSFLTVKPTGDETVDLNFQTKKFKVDQTSEKKMLELVNKERVSEGLSKVVTDSNLQEVAREHCKDMFVRGYFSHYTPEGLSPFDRMKNAGIEYEAAGENLAYAPTVDIAHRGLMESPGHRANILSKNFGKLGVAVIDAGIYGRMFCQTFSN